MKHLYFGNEQQVSNRAGTKGPKVYTLKLAGWFSLFADNPFSLGNWDDWDRLNQTN